MNRKQRRQLSKHMGILKFQSNLPYDKKRKLISENLLDGKARHMQFEQETYNKIMTDLQEKENLIKQGIISKLVEEGMTIEDAQIKANILYKQMYDTQL